MTARARISDLDGVIIPEIGGRTRLEALLMDHHKTQHGLERMSLAARATFVKLCRKFIQGFVRGWHKYDFTGETSMLKICHAYYMCHTKIPYTFMQERAKVYAQYISPEVREAIINCHDDIFIATTDFTDLTKEIFIAAGLENHIKGIFGTNVKVEDGYIVGIDMLSFRAGRSGKYYGLDKVSSNGYKEILVMGNSLADTGLCEARNVRPFAPEDADPDFKKFVLKRGGYITKSAAEFFNYKN